MPNARTIERSIRRLTREIQTIEQFFYVQNSRARHLHLGMLERKRDDVVRSAVLQLHTATEDILTSFIFCRLLNGSAYTYRRKLSSNSGKALRKLLLGGGSIGFDMKLNLAVALRIIRAGTKEKLAELNTVRNKCSHNWLLKAPVRRGRRPAQLKPPLLDFRGRDLHRAEVLRQFVGEYGPLYAALFARYISLG